MVAKIVMQIWIKKFREKLERAGLEVLILRKYVDDVLIVCQMTKSGHTLSKEGILERTFETFSRDKRERVKPEERTLGILQEIANGILPFLNFTGEASIEGNPIPVLDSQVWVGELVREGTFFNTDGEMVAPGESGEGPLQPY